LYSVSLAPPVQFGPKCPSDQRRSFIFSLQGSFGPDHQYRQTAATAPPRCRGDTSAAHRAWRCALTRPRRREGRDVCQSAGGGMARKGTMAVVSAGRTFGEVRTREEGVERLREDSEGCGENASRKEEGEGPSTSADEEHWRCRYGRPRRHHIPRATNMGSAACADPGATGSTPPCPSSLHGGRGSSACLGLAQSWHLLRGLPRTTSASSWDCTMH